MSKEIITNTHLTFFDHCFISVFKIQLKQESVDIMTALDSLLRSNAVQNLKIS
jgi:hypothetical protein